MHDAITRRGLLAAASWIALTDLPALADGETIVPFTDLPSNFNPTPTPDRRTLDIRKIDGPLTPTDQFFTTQHLGHPVIDPAAYSLQISGIVDRPRGFSLADLRKMR